MDSWGRFDETSLPDRKAFYSKLYLENITDKDCMDAQKVFEEFNLKDHDLYVQSHTLLLVDVFGNFTIKCTEIYKLDPAHFFVSSRISLARLFKKDRNKIRIIYQY